MWYITVLPTQSASTDYHRCIVFSPPSHLPGVWFAVLLCLSPFRDSGPGNIAGTPPSSSLRCMPSFLSRETRGVKQLPPSSTRVELCVQTLLFLPGTFFRRFLRSVFARNIFLHQCHLRPGAGKGWGVHLSPPPIPGSPLNTLLGRKTRLTRLPGHTRPQFGIISCFLIRPSVSYLYCIFLPAMPSCQTTSHYSYTGISVFFLILKFV